MEFGDLSKQLAITCFVNYLPIQEALLSQVCFYTKQLISGAQLPALIKMRFLGVLCRGFRDGGLAVIAISIASVQHIHASENDASNSRSEDPFSFSIVRDIAFSVPGGVRSLDLYLPAVRNAAQVKPCIIWFHGGGGDKADMREVHICETLAVAGYLCASVNFGSDGVSKENILACKSAVRFLRANAKTYKIAPDKIAVGGASLGGYLALMVAFTSESSEFDIKSDYPGVSGRVCAVLDFYGPTDFATIPEKQRPGTAKVMPVSAYNQMAPIFSPVTYINHDSPAVLILHGVADSNVDYHQAVEMADTLTRLHVAHEFLLLQNVGHGFDLVDWNGHPLPTDLRLVVLRFLERHIR